MRTLAPGELTPLPIDLGERPPRFPSAFDEVGPHPLAQRAAHLLQRSLAHDDQAEGKVFGVLVVEDAPGSFGFLKAFSGKWGGRWVVEGFAPPMFDVEVRARLDAASDAVITPLHERLATVSSSAELIEARQALIRLERTHAAEKAAMTLRHRENRQVRAALRAAAASGDEADQLSRGDTAEKRALAQRSAEALTRARGTLGALERRVGAARRLLSYASAKLVKPIIELPRVPNARGESRPIASFFSKVPPGGVGECAAPKLLSRAFALGLTPVALAEFWWGPTQESGRVRGAHVPACKLKCAPILPFMLEGLEVGAPRRLITRLDRDAPLRVIYEDAQLRVIEKPEGLLSVSGREATHVDSVETRMPEAWVVHRLDLDTSGLLVLALDEPTHIALQQQFARRHVEKRYVAVVERSLEAEQGTIELALRPDVDDRPRQMHDAQRGKEAITTWSVISRDNGRTRVALSPLTGRTHQLRVHCAHPSGLNAPIVGDRLYGHPGARLLLHCEWLALTHPATGQRLTFEAKAPF